MKTIVRSRKVRNGCEYILSSGWEGDTPYRLEVIDNDNWFDMFLDYDELRFLCGFITDGMIEVSRDEDENLKEEMET